MTRSVYQLYWRQSTEEFINSVRQPGDCDSPSIATFLMNVEMPYTQSCYRQVFRQQLADRA